MNLRPSGYEPDELPTAPLRVKNKIILALVVGLEPTAYRLTAGCSTVELHKLGEILIFRIH